MTNKQAYEDIVKHDLDSFQELLKKGYEETSEFFEMLIRLAVDFEFAARSIEESHLSEVLK